MCYPMWQKELCLSPLRISWGFWDGAMTLDYLAESNVITGRYEREAIDLASGRRDKNGSKIQRGEKMQPYRLWKMKEGTTRDHVMWTHRQSGERNWGPSQWPVRKRGLSITVWANVGADLPQLSLWTIAAPASSIIIIHGRLWAGVTQLSQSQIPDPQQLWDECLLY